MDYILNWLHQVKLSHPDVLAASIALVLLIIFFLSTVFLFMFFIKPFEMLIVVAVIMIGFAVALQELAKKVTRK